MEFDRDDEVMASSSPDEEDKSMISLGDEEEETFDDGEEEEEEEETDFHKEDDKLISSQIKIQCWCPTMDLLAVVTMDERLYVQRLNWKQIFSLHLDDDENDQEARTRLTALAWRPDGRVLGVGCDDGAVVLLNVENGLEIFRTRLHQCEIACMSWAREGNVSSRPEPTMASNGMHAIPTLGGNPSSQPLAMLGGLGRMEEIVEPLPPLPNDASYGSLEKEPDEKAAPAAQHFNILCCGDADGEVSLSALGTLLVARFNVADRDIGRRMAKECRIVQLNLSADLSKLTLLALCRPDGEVDRPHPFLLMLDYDTALLRYVQVSLAQLALIADSIFFILEEISEALELIVEPYTQALGSFRGDVKKLLEKQSDFSGMNNGMEQTLMGEFQSLLLVGHPLPNLLEEIDDQEDMGDSGSLPRTIPTHMPGLSVLSDYLATIKAKGLKKMGKDTANHFSKVISLVHKHLQPATDQLMFRLSELASLSHIKDKYTPIGLKYEDTELFLDSLADFSDALESFIRKTQKSQRQSQAFFLWLLDVLQKREEVPPSRSAARTSRGSGHEVDLGLVAEFINDQVLAASSSNDKVASSEEGSEGGGRTGDYDEAMEELLARFQDVDGLAKEVLDGRIAEAVADTIRCVNVQRVAEADAEVMDDEEGGEELRNALMVVSHGRTRMGEKGQQSGAGGSFEERLEEGWCSDVFGLLLGAGEGLYVLVFRRKWKMAKPGTEAPSKHSTAPPQWEVACVTLRPDVALSSLVMLDKGRVLALVDEPVVPDAEEDGGDEEDGSEDEPPLEFKLEVYSYEEESFVPLAMLVHGLTGIEGGGDGDVPIQDALVERLADGSGDALEPEKSQTLMTVNMEEAGVVGLAASSTRGIASVYMEEPNPRMMIFFLDEEEEESEGEDESEEEEGSESVGE